MITFKMTFKRAMGVGLAIGVVLVVGVLGWRTTFPPGPPEPLTIAIADTVLGVPLWAVERQGFFVAEGLAVTLRHYASGQLALEALLRGEADVATVAETPIVFAALVGAPLRIIANFSTSSETSVVARADRGINLASDLKGHRVGTAPGTTAHYYLHVLLSDYGLTDADVELVPVPAGEQVAALAAGRVDAVAAFAPYSTQCRLILGDNARTFSAGLRYTGYGSLVAAPEFTRRRPAAALKLLRATDRGILWLRGHPREARAFAGATLGLAEPVVADAWNRLRPNLALDQGYIILLQAEARWALAAHLVPALVAGAPLPHFHDLIDSSALVRLHPDAVTVIAAP